MQINHNGELGALSSSFRIFLQVINPKVRVADEVLTNFDLSRRRPNLARATLYTPGLTFA